MRQMEVVGVRVEMATNNPIVLLKETDGERYLPIWIGPNEATAIAFAQQGMVPQRPLTHDLMRDVLEALGIRLTTVNITALRDGIFFADLIFSPMAGRSVRARRTPSRWRCGPGLPSSSARRYWMKRESRSRTSRKTRSRSSGSSWIPSHLRISAGLPELPG